VAEQLKICTRPPLILTLGSVAESKGSSSSPLEREEEGNRNEAEEAEEEKQATRAASKVSSAKSEEHTVWWESADGKIKLPFVRSFTLLIIFFVCDQTESFCIFSLPHLCQRWRLSMICASVDPLWSSCCTLSDLALQRNRTLDDECDDVPHRLFLLSATIFFFFLGI
jgi:hypothetical protein